MKEKLSGRRPCITNNEDVTILVDVSMAICDREVAGTDLKRAGSVLDLEQAA
jgi:hypothetical protein